MVVKAATTVPRRKAHTQAYARLDPAVFLSPPLPSFWESDDSPNFKCGQNDKSIVVESEGR